MTTPLPPNVVFGDKKRETVQATTVSEAGQASTEEQELLVRKLTFTSEAEKRRKNLDAAPDAPSFYLGFETQEETVDPAITMQEDSTKVEETMHGSIQGQGSLDRQQVTEQAGCSKGEDTLPQSPF